MSAPNKAPTAPTSDVDLEAESIMLPVVDTVSATSAPTTLAQFWHEPEYVKKREEQEALWDAEGELAAREALVSTAGGALVADTDASLVKSHAALLAVTLTLLTSTMESLAPYRRRPAKAKLWHHLAKAAFLLGDLAGIATAAIWMGEIPAIAVVMAISAATATVAAGLSGGEVRDVRDRIRRSRPTEELPETLVPFAHHFAAPDKGWPFVKALVYVSIGIGAVIACAIFGLRTSIEGALSGIVYGGIALAIAAASWLEQYCYTDAIADQIDAARADYVRERDELRALAASSPWEAHAKYETEAESIAREHALRGAAAAHHLDALSSAIKRRNPAVAGHGPAAEPTVIGQTTRRSGGAK
ncbi:hypothetical protein [Microbacterium sp. 10M-3C3]|uniref:hypothetical protein n=1 Tax=Microbacterium sp. 10M-3C3 TaxID=2483401 RepID=UPI000F62D0E8|nr:hypothetical protein [Microbacterium sp. 10M-3C3]